MILGMGVLSFGGLAIAGAAQGGLVTPPYAGSLMGVVGADTPVGYNAFGGIYCVDFVNQKLFFLESGTVTGEGGLKKIDALPPGNELLQHTDSDYFSSGHFLSNSTDPCFHPNGKIYAGYDLSNSSPFVCINGDDLSLAGLFGEESSSLSPPQNNPFRILYPFQLTGIVTASNDYLIARSDTGHHVAIIDVTYAAELLEYFVLGEEILAFCSGYSGRDRSFATFYVLGRKSNFGFGDPTPSKLYEFIVGDSTPNRVLRSIVPTDIDPTWTNFTLVSDPGFDKLDGGALAFFQTQDAVTTTDYLVKFARADGAIMWRLPLPDGTPGVNLPHCNINGTLEFFIRQLSGISYVQRVNLTDGTTTSTTWNRGFSTMSQQVFDYLTGSITANMSYSAGSGPIPTYMGDYLANNGNSIPSSRWGRIYSGAPYPNPSDDNGSGEGTSGVQRRIAWSFALDGHTFYVLDLGDEGTFAWDDISKHWASFTTSSTDPQWNMAGGCMWGDRIVAGDLASGQVWELNPNAVQDNGALDIQHLATGIVTRRSRNYMGVGALRVAASIGQIQDGAGATMSLRFSDDQEKTWSAYYTVALTQGDYSSEIAYRALGSFAAPGRVFELSDTGGLIRIDGCDLDPEKDQDEPVS